MTGDEFKLITLIRSIPNIGTRIKHIETEPKTGIRPLTAICTFTNTAQIKIVIYKLSSTTVEQYSITDHRCEKCAHNNHPRCDRCISRRILHKARVPKLSHSQSTLIKTLTRIAKVTVTLKSSKVKLVNRL